jgi:hypothetical protein
MTETSRIRWETGQFGNLVGYAGTVESWAFQVWHISDDEDSHWSLISSLPDVANWNATDPDDPEALKAEAERWLERFVSSLGAIFPDRLREAVTSERDAHRMMAGEGHGDCPHSWSSHTSCGSARALDWVLDQMVTVTAAGEDG